LKRPDPFDRRSMMASMALHLALLVVAWATTTIEREEFEFISYQIELVSPPAAVQAEAQPATEQMVVERPDPTPPALEPESDPVQEEVPIELPEERPPDPEPEAQAPVAELTEPDEEATPASSPDPPPEDAEESGEGINVRLEGVRRDYPAYYNTIIRQIYNCFRWRDGGSWEATVYFVIERDGGVADMRFVSRSGNTAFDFEALGAVECAGSRFGALPDDLPYDQLPVQFDFRPSGDFQLFIPAEAPSRTGLASER
jgi:outer membrane biosynthesis protein TonB